MWYKEESSFEIHQTLVGLSTEKVPSEEKSYINKIQTWMISTKGQLISKGLFGTLEFLQKTNEKFVYSTVRPKK